MAGGADNYVCVGLTAAAGIMVGGGGGKIESESDQVHCVASNFAGLDGCGHFFLAGVANRGFTISDNYVIYLFRYLPTPLFAKIIYQNGVGVLNSGNGCFNYYVTNGRTRMKGKTKPLNDKEREAIRRGWSPTVGSGWEVSVDSSGQVTKHRPEGMGSRRTESEPVPAPGESALARIRREVEEGVRKIEPATWSTED